MSRTCNCKESEYASWTIWGDEPKPTYENLKFEDAKRIVDTQFEEMGTLDLYAQCDEHGTEYEGE